MDGNPLGQKHDLQVSAQYIVYQTTHVAKLAATARWGLNGGPLSAAAKCAPPPPAMQPLNLMYLILTSIL